MRTDEMLKVADLHDELVAENARLRKALKPFADAITRAEWDEPSNPVHRLECCRADLTLYEFAEARHALGQ